MRHLANTKERQLVCDPCNPLSMCKNCHAANRRLVYLHAWNQLCKIIGDSHSQNESCPKCCAPKMAVLVAHAQGPSVATCRIRGNDSCVRRDSVSTERLRTGLTTSHLKAAHTYEDQHIECIDARCNRSSNVDVCSCPNSQV